MSRCTPPSAALVTLAALVVGCGDPYTLSTPVKAPPPPAATSERPVVATALPTTATLDQARCSATRKPSAPDTVTLDPSARAELDRLRALGAVAVRYEGEGCDAEIQVLSSCIAPAQKYAFSAYPATARKVARDPSELLATMPLGAPSLVGWVGENRAVRTDFVLAGQYALAPDAVPRVQDLRGPDCARATHVVSAVYVGAFSMVAGETAILERRATVMDLGSTAPELQVLAAEGNAEACRAAEPGKPHARCAVPLRLSLVPLVEAAPVASAAATCPAGSVRKGERCVMKEIVTEVDCPAGTKWQVDRCAPRVDTTCAAGMRFEAGRGCIPESPKKAAPPPMLAVASVPPPAARVEEVGYVSFDTYPYTRVSIDGRDVGVTPIVQAAVPAGTHTITFENPQESILRTTTVTVKAGENVSRRLAF